MKTSQILTRKLNQNQLDLLATIFGTIAGVAELLVSSGRLNNQDGQLIAGLAMIAWGIISNKNTPGNRKHRLIRFVRNCPNNSNQ